MPPLFAELRRDGQIDWALAAARAALLAASPWWMPTLWMAVRDGALWPAPAERVPDAGVFQVPYLRNPLFRGRDAELAELVRVLLGPEGATTAVPALAGTGGIGKTQLASEFAHRYRDNFPGGVFWLAMEQPDAIASQVAAAGGPGGLDLPGWAGQDFDARLAAVRRAWAEPAARLTVFDNLEEPRLLQEWRPRGGAARLLITTRRGVWAATTGVQLVQLRTLARAESVRLLLAPRAQARGLAPERLLDDPVNAGEADAICEAVGDLPLALALAGAYLEATPSLSLAGYRARLAESLLAHPSLNAELEEGLPTRHAESVAATIALSYTRLDAARAADALALTLLQRMAQLAPAAIPQRLLVRLAGRDPDDETQAVEVDGALRRLSAVGLCEPLPEGGALLHRLIAAFVRHEDGDSEASSAAAIDGLSAEVYAINQAGYPLRGKAYLPHLIALAQPGSEGRAERQATLLSNLGALLDAQGDLAGARPYYERALAVCERVLGPAHPDTANSINNLGYLLRAQGDLAGARPYYERALAVCERVLGPAHPDTAYSLWWMAYLTQRTGNLADERLLYERALSIFRLRLGEQHSYTQAVQGNLAALLRTLEASQGGEAR